MADLLVGSFNEGCKLLFCDKIAVLACKTAAIQKIYQQTGRFQVVNFWFVLKRLIQHGKKLLTANLYADTWISGCKLLGCAQNVVLA